MIYEFFVEPLVEYSFLRRAVAGTFVLSLGAAPVGVFLVLRRLALAGEAMSHAAVPGIAIAYLLAGLSVVSLTIGGLITGLAVTLLSGLIARATVQHEDASLAAIYLIALASGIFLLSLYGSHIDLSGFLFGSVLGLDNDTLIFIGIATTITLLSFAVMIRGLVMECLDPQFFRAVGGGGAAAHLVFVVLVVLNLVAGFKALGTLMSVGLIILPAASARYWARTITGMLVWATGIAVFSCYAGLLVSLHASTPSGPSIILIAGAVFILSLLLGPLGVLQRPKTGARAEGSPAMDDQPV